MNKVIVCLLFSIVVSLTISHSDVVGYDVLTAEYRGDKIQIKINLEEEKRIQAAVDKGHQPWRLEPIDVAYVALTAAINEKIEYETCSLISETSKDAIVTCKSKKTFTVHLKRIVREKGIWTATVIELGKSNR